MDKGIKSVVALLLALVSVVLIYLTYKGVSGPLEFDKTQAKRERVLQAKLKSVVAYQKAYEERYGRFATLEELKMFLAQDSVFSIKSEGEYTSEMRDKKQSESELAYKGNRLYAKGTGLSVEEIIAKGLLVRDTTWRPASTLLEGMSVEEVFVVPAFGDTKASLILIDTASIEQIMGNDTVQRSVFEAKVPCEVYLADQEENLLKDQISLLKERRKGKGYPGLKIGSLEEIKETGNWE